MRLFLYKHSASSSHLYYFKRILIFLLDAGLWGTLGIKSGLDYP